MPTTARGAVLRAFHEPLEIAEAEIPAPEPGAVIARIGLAGICGTDIHLSHGNLPIPTPLILGHEAVGTVAALGEGVTEDFTGAPLAVGDAITWTSSISCGRCHWCVVEGERTLCETRRVYGINQRFDAFPRLSGGFAEAIYLQPGSAIFKLPEGVTPDMVIALGCAGPTAYHGVVDITKITPGDTVLVQGAGPVGIAAAMYAHLGGAARVLMVGGPQARLDLARSMGVGTDWLDIFTVTDPAERLAWTLERTPFGRGADVVLECTGVPSAVQEGMDAARRNGKMLVLGQYTDRGATPINPHTITKKQLTMLGSWAFSERHYLGHLRNLPAMQARFGLDPLITRYRLEDVNQAMADMAGGVMKPVLVM
jgi:D-arabinose 1-dehydrogenase-like Zn-dependent alcohol dehydrogenase